MHKFSKWLKKYFIPHEHNDHNPHFLRHESMLFLFMLVIIVELGFLAQVFLVFDKTKFLALVLPNVLTELTNEERQNYDAPPLRVNDLLTKAAELKAEDMAQKGYFAHTSPEGKSPWYWLAQVGYSYASAGENLAVNFFDSDDVDRAWMNSPTHKANIIKKEYTEIGIGVARGVYQGESTIFVAQFFGRPLSYASSAPQPAITTTATTQVTEVAATPTTTPTPKTATVTTTPTPKTTTPKAPVAPVKTIPKTTPTPTQVASAPAPVETVATNNNSPVPAVTTVLGEETDTKSSALTTLTSSIKSYIQKSLTSPSHGVAVFYGVLALITIMALMIFLFVRSEIRHPAVMVRGLALISVIVFLLYVNIQVLSIKTVVPTDGDNFYTFIAS